MKFYNMRRRCYTLIPDEKCSKREIHRGKRRYYMVSAIDVDGSRLTRVISHETYKTLK